MAQPQSGLQWLLFFTSISTKTKSLNFLKLKNIEIKIFRAKKQALIQMALIWSNTGKQSPEPYNTVYIVWWLLFLKFNQKSKFIKKRRKENLFSKNRLDRKDDKILYGGCERKNNKIR